MREDVIFRKLLADGECTGEERRFHVLAHILKDMSVSCDAASAARAIRQIELMELSLQKSLLIADTCSEEAANYNELEVAIDNGILESKDKMTKAKADLVAARIVRKNRQEYAQLSKMINDVPSRADTNKKLEEIQEELDQQHDKQKLLESKLSERRKHLHAFNIILGNFQKFLNDEDECPSMEDDRNTQTPDDLASTPKEKEDGERDQS